MKKELLGHGRHSNYDEERKLLNQMLFQAWLEKNRDMTCDKILVVDSGEFSNLLEQSKQEEKSLSDLLIEAFVKEAMRRKNDGDEG